MESKINSIITTLFALSALWPYNANAADKTETLKGTITLGATGYAVRLENGKVIGFMGRGGNKVFAACHNGDTCEITGVVIYNIKHPLFVTIKSVRKLQNTASETKHNDSVASPPARTAQTTVPEDQADSSSPFLVDKQSSQ